MERFPFAGHFRSVLITTSGLATAAPSWPATQTLGDSRRQTRDSGWGPGIRRWRDMGPPSRAGPGRVATQAPCGAPQRSVNSSTLFPLSLPSAQRASAPLPSLPSPSLLDCLAPHSFPGEVCLPRSLPRLNLTAWSRWPYLLTEFPFTLQFHSEIKGCTIFLRFLDTLYFSVSETATTTTVTKLVNCATTSVIITHEVKSLEISYSVWRGFLFCFCFCLSSIQVLLYYMLFCFPVSSNNYLASIYNQI